MKKNMTLDLKDMAKVNGGENEQAAEITSEGTEPVASSVDAPTVRRQVRRVRYREVTINGVRNTIPEYYIVYMSCS